MKMLRNLLNKKSTSSKQDTLIQSLEGIGDILVFETKRKKNKMVLDGLKKISDLVKKISEIQKLDPDKFDLYKKDKKEMPFSLDFSQKKYPINFSTAINQIVRVYEAAINSQNEEISKFSVYHIHWILEELSSRQNNALFVEQILEKLAEITRTAIQRNDRPPYDAAIHWYIGIVFNGRGKKSDFLLSYLNLFDEYFFFAVQYIVAEKQNPIFQSLVSYLVDGIDIPNYHHEFWNYENSCKRLQKYNQLDKKHGLEKKIKELAGSENDLHTQEKLEAWLKKFDELKASIEPSLGEEQKNQHKRIEEKIRDFATLQFKHQHLLEIVFAVGAYCLFKKRYDYIKYLWEYKQPPDSDASWNTNQHDHDITPTTLDEVIKFYFRKGPLEKKFYFREDHHGSDKYYKQYFLLLLARILQSASLNTEGKYSRIEGYKFPDLHIDRLNGLKCSVDEFISLASDLKQAENLLAEVGFDIAKLDEIFDKKLIPFLNKLKEEAGKQISAKHRAANISQRQVQGFKKEVLKAFYEEANMRDIFANHFNAYEDKIREKITDKKGHFEITIRFPRKYWFSDEYLVRKDSFIRGIGQKLASGENSYLLDNIEKNCKEITKKDFEVTLSQFKNLDDVVIFMMDSAFWQFFEYLKNFESKLRRDIKQLEVGGFVGWYDFNGKTIPVFERYGYGQKDGYILILNKSKVGQLVQLSPFKEGESEKSVEDIFYMDIQAFSENEELMEEFIKNPLEWLKKIGDEQKQREHLQELVRIQIFERFEYIKPDDFEGYKLFLQICKED